MAGKVRNTAPAGGPPPAAWEETVGQVINADCAVGMGSMPAESVDLVFADPPFNIGEDYDEHDDNMALDDYLRWSSDWLQQAARILKPSGSLWIASGWRYAAELKILAEARYCLTEYPGGDAWYTIGRSREAVLQFRQQVIWYYTFGVNSPRRFTPSHTVLLHLVRSIKGHKFNETKVRVPSARQLEYNDRRASPRGRLPDDTWILRPADPRAGFQPEHDVQPHSRIAGTFKGRMGTPNQMPEQLVGRIVRSCTDPGDLVVDPFAGSGTTAAVAKKLGRKFITFEMSAPYASQARLRVDSVKEGDALDGPIQEEEAR